MTTQEPLVSVLMSVYNGMPYLTEAIESVVAQDHKHLEVCVVDDGSDDESAACAASFGPPVIVERHSRMGQAHARNRSLELARGEYVMFHDADDLLSRRAVSTLLQALSADPSLDLVWAHVDEFVSPELGEDERRRMRDPMDRVQGRLPTNMLARRSAAERVGGFNPALRRGVTMDWTARALDIGLCYTVLEDVLFHRRLHPGSNGTREAANTDHYLRVVKAKLDRARSASTDPATTR